MVHGMGSYVIREPLKTNGLKERVAGVAGERVQSHREGWPRENVTAKHLGRKE